MGKEKEKEKDVNFNKPYSKIEGRADGVSPKTKNNSVASNEAEDLKDTSEIDSEGTQWDRKMNFDYSREKRIKRSKDGNNI